MTVIDRLVAARDETYRTFQVKLVPNIDADKIIGVRTPELRKIAKEVFASEDCDAFLQTLPHTYYEENLINYSCFVITGGEIYDY